MIDTVSFYDKISTINEFTEDIEIMPINQIIDVALSVVNVLDNRRISRITIISKDDKILTFNLDEIKSNMFIDNNKEFVNTLSTFYTRLTGKCLNIHLLDN